MTAAIVVDASALAGALLADEAPAFAFAVMEHVSAFRAVAPALFWSEIRNLLIMAERAGRVEAPIAEEELRALRPTGLDTAQDPGDGSVMAMARPHRLTAYGATYAATAARVGLALATLDKDLIAAGKAGAFKLWRPL